MGCDNCRPDRCCADRRCGAITIGTISVAAVVVAAMVTVTTGVTRPGPAAMVDTAMRADSGHAAVDDVRVRWQRAQTRKGYSHAGALDQT